MNNSYKKLTINTLLVFVGKAGGTLIALLMLPLYTRWLSTEEYGRVDLINTYATILLSIASCSIASAIFVIPKKSDEDNQKSYFSSGLLFLIICSAIVILTSFSLGFFPAEGNFIIYNRWYIAFLTLSMIWQNYSQQFLRALDKMALFSSCGVIQSIAIASLAFIFIPNLGVQGYLLSLIVANFITFIFSFTLSKSYHYISIDNIEKGKLKELLAYSIPLVPNSIMWWLVNGFNRPLMESYLGLSAIGLYAVAMKFPNIINSLSDVFMNAYSISMIEEYGKTTFKAFFNNTFRIVVFFLTMVAVGIIVFSKLIISIFAAPEFFEAWRILPVLTLSSVFSCAASIVGGIFVARRASKYYFYSSIWGAITSVVFTFALIHIWGLLGCAVAVSISFLSMYIARVYYAREDVGGVVWFFIQSVLLIGIIMTSLFVENVICAALFYVFIGSIMCYKNRDLIQIGYAYIKQRFVK